MRYYFLQNFREKTMISNFDYMCIQNIFLVIYSYSFSTAALDVNFIKLSYTSFRLRTTLDELVSDKVDSERIDLLVTS